MKSSERRCHALTIFENVHGAKMEKGMYTNLYTEIWDSMIFRDMVNKCTMNTKPAKMAVCGFVILREILGLSSSPSAEDILFGGGSRRCGSPRFFYAHHQ